MQITASNPSRVSFETSETHRWLSVSTPEGLVSIFFNDEAQKRAFFAALIQAYVGCCSVEVK